MSSTNPFSENPPAVSQPTVNPYASPSMASLADPGILADEELRKMVKNFRSQMHSLGGLWIFFSVIVLGLSALILGVTVNVMQDPNVRAVVMLSGIIYLFLGVVWGTVGVFTCLKHIWAVWVGLILCYLSLIGNIITFNPSKILALIIAFAILGAAIFQAHRVIGWAKQMRAKGIPLTARPDQIQTPLNLPQM
jgi:hypothetical protein